jgi:hypothetical protein
MRISLFKVDIIILYVLILVNSHFETDLLSILYTKIRNFLYQKTMV